MSKRLFVCAGIVTLGLLTTVCSGENKSVAVSPAADPGDSGEGYVEPLMIMRGKKIPVREANRRNIRRLSDELREAGDEKQKAAITKQLESVVGDVFDLDLKQREAELSKLEARLKKLHEQLDRRRQARGEIIQLKVKVLANEAAGLGFSSEGRKGDFGLQIPDFTRGQKRGYISFEPSRQ
jgi:hypothetical protein